MSDSTPPSDSASVNSRVDSQIAIARARASRPCRPPARGANDDHPAARPHLARGDVRLRMGVPPVGQARVADPVDVVAVREVAGDRGGVRRVALDPQRERPQPAQHEEAVERPGHGAHRVLEEAQPLGQVVAIGHGDPADGVRVAGEVLRRRVEHDVRAERQRALEGRRRERVVDDEQRPLGIGRRGGRRARSATASMSMTFRCGFDGVSSQTSRVVASSPSRRTPAGSVARSAPAGRDPAWPGDPLEVAPRAAVDVVADEDRLAWSDELGDRGRRRGAARERDPVPAALEGGDRPLQPLAGRVLAPGVLVAAGSADRRLPGRTCSSGRSAARPRRSARRAPGRRGPPASRSSARPCRASSPIHGRRGGSAAFVDGGGGPAARVRSRRPAVSRPTSAGGQGTRAGRAW